VKENKYKTYAFTVFYSFSLIFNRNLRYHNYNISNIDHFVLIQLSYRSCWPIHSPI